MKSFRRKKITALCAAAALSLTAVFPSQAYGPAELKEVLGEEGSVKIMDHVVEWDEVPYLVEYWNPTYRLYADSADGFLHDLDMGRDADVEEIRKSLETIDKNMDEIKKQRKELAKLPGDMIIDQHGTTVAQSLAMLDQTEQYLKETRKTAQKGIGQLGNTVHQVSKSYESALNPVKDQLTKVVQGLMISYQQLLVNRSMVEKQVALYRTILATKQDMQQKSLASEAEVNAARAQLSDAEVTLATIDNGLSELKRAIGLQTGYPAADPPEIGAVPVPAITYADGIDPEADRKKALDNSKELESAADIKTYSGSGALQVRDGMENEKRGELSGKFDRLYASVKEQQLISASAETSLRRAQLTRDQAGRQYALGLLGKAELEARELEVISYEAAVSNARLSLAQAVLNYEWALKGYFD